MNDILVTVIIPAYNVEKYILRCLRSIKDQTYKNLEVIIVNDGSTDNTLYLIQEFIKGDKRFKVFSQDNAGLSSARNLGMMHINGKYTTFIDADDYIHFDCIRSMLELAVNFNAHIVSCDCMRCVDIDVLPMKKEKITYKHYKNRCADVLFSGCDLNYACGKLIKSCLITKIKWLFPEGKIYEDIGSVYKLYDQCDSLVRINNKFYYYFIRQGSITSKRKLLHVQDRLYHINEMNQYELRMKYKYWNMYRLLKLFGALSDLYNIKDIEKNEIKKYESEIYNLAKNIPIINLKITQTRNSVRVVLLKTHLATIYFHLKQKSREVL